MTQETHYCSFCGKSNHEVSDMAVKDKICVCSECIALASGVFILNGNGVFKKSIEDILSVSNACGVKTAGIDVQAKNIVTAAMYHQGNEVKAEDADDSTLISDWSIQVYSDKVLFTRIKDGAMKEGYAPVSLAKAAVYAAAIVNGLRPPRDLYQCDIPTD
ncbi:ATP-dependent Clp protease ATP-binding subunit ClpX [Rahnella aquatilis]|nr:ATP-dependent Clp protease ATP-binding subunit ClpX [Rahnella aquatilis]